MLRIRGFIFLFLGLSILLTVPSCKRKTDSRNEKPQSIYEAVKKENMAAIEEFLSKGVEVDARDFVGLTALHCAAGYGKTEVAQYLLNKGANIHCRCVNGETPLHHAASFGRVETAELLITNGAHVNAIDKKGATPLHHAATTGQVTVVKLLLANGADVKIQDENGRTPLECAGLVRERKPSSVRLPAKLKKAHEECAEIIRQYESK